MPKAQKFMYVSLCRAVILVMHIVVHFSAVHLNTVQCRMFGVSLNLQNVSGGRGNLQGLPHMHSIGATLHYSTLHYITLHYTTLPWSLKPPQTPCHGVKTANWANLDKVSRFASGNRGKPSLRW